MAVSPVGSLGVGVPCLPLAVLGAAEVDVKCSPGCVYETGQGLTHGGHLGLGWGFPYSLFSPSSGNSPGSESHGVDGRVFAEPLTLT